MSHTSRPFRLDSTAALATVQRAQAGDRAAVAELYLAYRQPVYAYVMSRVRDVATAEDLTADTFVRMLRSLHTFTDTGHNFGAWLTVIARNRVLDHFRSSHYRNDWPVGDFADCDAVDLHLESWPEETVLARDELAPIAQLVTLLTGEQQQVIQLRFLSELSITETAQVMGKNEGAVKTLQFRATQKLRRLMTLRDAAVPV